MDKDEMIVLWEQRVGAELFAKDVDATCRSAAQWGRRRSSTKWSRVSRILVEWITSSQELRRHTGNRGPLVVIARFRDGTLAHEHIYWDQASVLVQLGLLAVETLPIAGASS
jgi:hypothetical protein